MEGTQSAGSRTAGAKRNRLGSLAHFTARHRWPVIGVWIVLTLIGGVAAGKLSSRWYQSFSIPGKPAYEASQRELKAFGVGVRPPNVVVFHTTKETRPRAPRSVPAMLRAAAAIPGALHELVLLDAPQPDVHLEATGTPRFMEVYPAGKAKFDTKSGAKQLRAAAAAGLPAGITVNVTGHDPLEEASSHGGGGSSSVLLEAPDRRPRSARDPAVRVRHAAGHPDAGRGRGGGDPEHVHARLGPDLHHERVDHRPVPDRAGRARCRDRLLAADDLPLPRRAPRGHRTSRRRWPRR